jgi:hypothetical protein
MAYIGKQPGTGVRNRFLYTATAGQTTFTTSDSNLALSYSDALYMDVYLNGVLLDPANDYTATSGTSVVLGSGATAGDILEIVVYDVFSVFNNTIDGNFEVGGNTTLDNNLTVGGDLTVDTNTLHVDSTNNRVGIGTSSPDASLHIEGSGVSALRFGNIGPSSNSAIRLSRDDITVTSGNPLGYLQFGGNDSTSNTDAAFAYVSGEASGTHGAGDNPTDLTFGTTADGSSTPAEHMRITSGGNIQIGSTNSGVAGAGVDVSIGSTASSDSGGITLFSPTDGTHSLGFADGTTGTDRYRGYVEYRHANDALAFATQSTERMRIESAGNIVQTSTISAGWSYAHNVTASSGQLLGHLIQFTGQAPNDASNYFLWMTDTSAARAYFRSDGGLANFQGNNANLSDEREKKNIEDAQDAWATVKSWQVRKFHFNEDADSDDKKYGVIAQEFQAHCPELITDYNKSPDPTSDPVIRLAVKEQGAMWLAIKALQEAQVKIETLETKVTTLETQNADLETKVASLETQNANFETRLTALEAE